MCLMLYIGSRNELQPMKTDWLSLEIVAPSRDSVRRHFEDVYHVYFIGAHTGCSCGFPHVLAEEEITYFDGMFDSEDEAERANDLQSVCELFGVLDQSLEGQADCLLLPVWNGDEELAVKGDVRWRRSAMIAEQIVLTEGFRYLIEVS